MHSKSDGLVASKNRHSFTAFFFLFLFLLSIFFFSKRILEPSLLLYRDPSFQPTSFSSKEPTVPIAALDPLADPQLNGAFLQQPISPISEPLSRTEQKTYRDPSFQPTSFSSKESTVPVAALDPLADPQLNGAFLQQPISPISEPLSRTEQKTYRDPSFQPTSFSSKESTVPVAALDPLADPQLNGAFLQQPISPISEPLSRTEQKTVSASGIKDGSSNGESGSGVDVGLSIEKNFSPKKVPKMCDFHRGMWVKDNEYPLYEPNACPYVDEAYSCQENGRRDLEYMKWRWKPEDCDLPRFNATDFLERLRGKRLMLVGDSMNRNQFESILCMLREGLSDKSRMYEAHGHKITKGRGYFLFKFVDYDCSVEFVRSHFLVKEGTRVNAQGNSNPTLSIDKIDKTAGRWKRADILVFNTGHWWTHGKTARGKNYYKEGDFLYPRFDAMEAYKRAMKTWGNWIDRNINPAKKLIFYRGYSSAHFRGGDWDSGGTCIGETEPILSGAFLDNYPPKMKIVEEVLREMRVPVILLNMTRMTNFRKDGHPSIYGKKQMEGQKVSKRRQDCSHWCLPGVPDAWNELIYSNLILHQTTSLD